MIAYEELEKALARWKARRPEAMAASGGLAAAGAMEEVGEATPMAREELMEATPMAREDLEATSMGEQDSGIPTGISPEDASAGDSTGEVEIGDAIPEER